MKGARILGRLHFGLHHVSGGAVRVDEEQQPEEGKRLPFPAAEREENGAHPC